MSKKTLLQILLVIVLGVIALGLYLLTEAPRNEVEVPTDDDQTAQVVTTTSDPDTEQRVGIFVFGGYDEGQGFSNQVLYSRNGDRFRALVPAPWSPRMDAGAISFAGKYWVLGGFGENSHEYETGYRNDVWSTVDGETWQLETAHAPWAPRAKHQAVVHNDQLYVIGGSCNTFDSCVYDDVWRSADGVTWELAGTLPEKRTRHGVTTFDEQLYVVAGYEDSKPVTSVVTSPDGAVWELTYANGLFFKKYNPGVTTFQDRVYIIGGEHKDEGAKADVWVSEDGATFNPVTFDTPFGPRSNAEVFTFDQGLYVLGGSGMTDLWRTLDGEMWSQVADIPELVGSGAVASYTL